ncbi:hypothetical protein ACK8HY_09865 [Sphingobacterium sp. NGMCC 1.201703]|uniref:hypothetical protein n=1 Tax=Sphingobacterium sp. NGMCC 1.201703 TaxID=3388657 RepID=UPI0039FBAC97
MKLAILYNGIPIQLPDDQFPSQELLFDVNGFLEGFTYRTTSENGEKKTAYRYFANDLFREKDRHAVSNGMGYFNVADYMEYIASTRAVTEIRRFDHSAFIASPGLEIEIEILDKGEPYKDYYNVANYKFTLEAAPSGTGTANYLKESFTKNALVREIRIPTVHQKTLKSYTAENKTQPDGYFYAHNFGDKISADNAFGSNYWARRKELMTGICLKIYAINKDIFSRLEGLTNLSAWEQFLETAESQQAFETIAAPGIAKLVFLMKHSWCHYYDLNADPKYIFKSKPEAILHTRSNDELSAYLIALDRFYTTLYGFDLSNYHRYNTAVLLMDILYFLPDTAYLFLDYDLLLNVVKDFLSLKKIDQQQQQVLVKVIIAIAESYGHETEFMEFLLTVDNIGKVNITYFEQLYSLLTDARKERYPIVNWFVEEKENKRYFSYAIFKIWKYSKYNWDFYPPPMQQPVTDEDFLSLYWLSDGEKYLNKNNTINFIRSQQFQSKDDAGKQRQQAYDYKSNLEGIYIDLKLQRTETVYAVIKPTDEFPVKVPPELVDLGKFHLFQPVILTNYEGNLNLDIPQTLTCPAFIMHFIKEYDEIADYDALIALGINVGADLVLFFAFGGLGSLRYLNYLRYTTQLGRALRGELIATEAVKVWAGLGAGSEAVSVSAGLLAGIGEYLATTDNDIILSQTWKKMQHFFSFLTLASAGASFFSQWRMYSLSEDLLNILSIAPTGINEVDAGTTDLINAIVGQGPARIANFEGKLSGMGNEASELLNWFRSTSLQKEKQRWFLDTFESATTSEIQLLNQHVTTLDSLIDMSAYRIAGNIKLVTAIGADPQLLNQVAGFYATTGSKQAFEKIDPAMWTRLFEAFNINKYDIKGIDRDTILANIASSPQVYIDLMESHFWKYKAGNAPDKYSVEEIFNIIRVNFEPYVVELLTDKNRRSIDEAIALFDRNSRHTLISDEMLISLFDSTHPDFISIASKLKDTSTARRELRTANKNITEVEAVGSGLPIQKQLFLGKSKDLKKYFEGGVLPIELTEVRGLTLFEIFNKKAYGDGRQRKYDSELKFIFDFLLNNWNKSDFFRVKITSTLTVCSSCKTYLWYLKKIARKYGKEIEYEIISNPNMIRVGDIKNLK